MQQTDPYLHQKQWLDEKRQAGTTILKGVTVDDRRCFDMDDAIACAQLDTHVWQMDVAIAYVPATVPLDSDICAEAMKKGRSFYSRKSPQYMFPGDVTEKLCSLNAHEIKPALHYQLTVDTQNETLDYTVSEVLFESQGKFTHDDFIKSGYTQDYLEPLNFLRERRLYNQHMQRHGHKDTSPSAYNPIEKHNTHMIIEEMMIMTNMVAADLAVYNDIPHIFCTSYIGHDKRRVKTYTCDPSAPGDTGYPHYGHNSSPIRRAVDLANQYNLQAALTDNAPPLDRSAMEPIAEHGNLMAYYQTMHDVVEKQEVEASYKPSRFHKRQNVNTIADFFRYQTS